MRSEERARRHRHLATFGDRALTDVGQPIPLPRNRTIKQPPLSASGLASSSSATNPPVQLQRCAYLGARTSVAMRLRSATQPPPCSLSHAKPAISPSSPPVSIRGAGRGGASNTPAFRARCRGRASEWTSPPCCVRHFIIMIVADRTHGDDVALGIARVFAIAGQPIAVRSAVSSEAFPNVQTRRRIGSTIDSRDADALIHI